METRTNLSLLKGENYLNVEEKCVESTITIQ